MALVERIKKAVKSEKSADLAYRLAELLPDKDADLLAARQAEREATTRFEQARADLAPLKVAVEDAAGRARAARLKLAEGPGTEEQLATAKKAQEVAVDRHDGAADLAEGLGVRLADARDRTRRVEIEARSRSREAITAIAATNIEHRLALYEQLEALVAEAGAIWSAYEVASPPVPCVIGRCGTEPLMAHRPE